MVLDITGAYHTLELGPLFGAAYLPDNPDVRNDTGLYYDPIIYNDFDKEYSEFIRTLWTNFAKFGYACI